MKVLIKDSLIEIKNTFKRFLSILLIVLLGVGFFAGIRATSPDMEKTLDTYFDNNNVMNIQVISTLGMTQSDIDEIEKIDGVEKAVGSYSKDVTVNMKEEEYVVKLNSLTDDEQMNQVRLASGRLPISKDECVVEEKFLELSGNSLGDSIEIILDGKINSSDDEQVFLNCTTMKIVGVVSSPLYISRERGSTKLGSGSISSCIYIPKSSISSDEFTEVYIRVEDAKLLSTFTKEYDKKVDNIKNKIKEITNIRKEARYNEIIDKANTKVFDAQKEFDEEKDKAQVKIDDAQNKLNDAQNKVTTAQQNLVASRSEANREFNKAQKEIINGVKLLNTKKTEFETFKKEAEVSFAEADVNIAKLNESKLVIDKGIAEAQNGLNNVNILISNVKKQILSLKEDLKNETNPGQIVILNEKIDSENTKLNGLNIQKKELETKMSTLTTNLSGINKTILTIQTTVTNGKNELLKNEDLLNKSSQDLALAQKKLDANKNSTYDKLNQGKIEIDDAKTEIGKNQIKLDEEAKKADAELKTAQNKIDEAKDKIKDIKRPDWYVLDRKSNAGFAEYEQDTQRIANIGKVFPIVFFVVAALISLTSMTRMVEEQRGQIGILKALGYNKISIAMKYVIYAVLATIIGSITGMVIGFELLPKLIFNIYAMMYTLPPVIAEFNMEYAITGIVIALCCTVGATIYSCIKELSSTPAHLMRPKSPKSGKRVLLEKIPFIWKRLKFTQKVTVRNIFRYKKRFLMTIIGILGCSSLIVAGFGLRDSISNMIPAQYQDIFKYQLQIDFKDDVTRENIEEKVAKISKNEFITDSLKANMQNVEILDRSSNQNIQLIVPYESQKLNEFIKLNDRRNSKPYTLDDDGIILTEKLAKLLNIKVGDSIKLKNIDDVIKEVKVSSITENYLMHYIYMSPNLYQKTFDENTKYNVLFSKTSEMSKDQEDSFSKEMLKDEMISKVVFTSSTSKYFGETMGNLNVVVWILIISAGLLAFVVLYNLANVNISERVRELATIKVLGFYDNEVYNYVAKETIILTGIGIAFGLIGGYFLNMFILQTCELDIFMFIKNVRPTSYIYAILITLAFSYIVNITTYFELKKINMIESLKSVE